MVIFGFINTIWDQCIGGIVRRHVLVTPLRRWIRTIGENVQAGLVWACDLVYNTLDGDEVISPVDVITHAAFRVRPVDTVV
jgi:hypothetical protein